MDVILAPSSQAWSSTVLLRRFEYWWRIESRFGLFSIANDMIRIGEQCIHIEQVMEIVAHKIPTDTLTY